jgi:hypothetical protein
MYQFSLTLNLATPEGKERFMKKWALDRQKVIVLSINCSLRLAAADSTYSCADCCTPNLDMNSMAVVVATAALGSVDYYVCTYILTSPYACIANCTV